MAQATALTRDNRAATKASSLPAPALATIAALVLCAIAPILIVYGTADDASSGHYVGPLIISMLSGLVYALILGSRTRHLYAMTFWLFVYVFLGIAPIIQLRLGQDTDTAGNINHDLDWHSTAVVLVGCLAFLCAWLFRRTADTSAVQTSDLSRAKINVLTVAAIIVFVYYGSKIGFGNLFTSRLQLDALRARVLTDRTSAALLTGAAQMGLLVAVVAQIHVRRALKAAGLRAPVLLLVIASVCLFICVNPISTPRYIFGTAILAVLTSVGAFSSLAKFRFVAMAAVFGMVYLFPIADMFRNSLTPSAKSQNPLVAMLSGDFDSSSQITNAVEYVETYGDTSGQQLLGVVFFWVPRGLWPDKPIDTGSMLADFKLYQFRNLSAPLWGELYVNGGWILLVAGMFMVGWMIRRLDKANELALSMKGSPGILGCILPFYLLILLRGSLLQSMAYLSVVLLAYVFVRRSTKTMPALR